MISLLLSGAWNLNLSGFFFFLNYCLCCYLFTRGQHPSACDVCNTGSSCSQKRLQYLQLLTNLWGETVAGAQSPIAPPQSSAVSKPPHLKDSMSETRRLVSIDLSDTWGSCQTHLQSEAGTHTLTHTHTGNKAGQTSVFPRQLDLTHWVNLSTVLFHGLPGECLLACRLQVSRDIRMVLNSGTEI